MYQVSCPSTKCDLKNSTMHNEVRIHKKHGAIVVLYEWEMMAKIICQMLKPLPINKQSLFHFAFFRISRKFFWKFAQILINYSEIELNFSNNYSEIFSNVSKLFSNITRVLFKIYFKFPISFFQDLFKIPLKFL